ncbi:molting protein mlt-4 [Anaeramoeba flamelloides]|uniref:Molting protein mlt-4 n=1 Tax=Anaeramoeba flamelloides TaxID=1746091 RepID=A0AAV7Y7Z9_9EUKA|nr:molting protein mlt-4 [Anaeramoeba flamelloides]
MQNELNVEQRTRLQHASTGEVIENFPIVLMNSKDSDELSPLHYICQRRNLDLELLTHFFNYKADPNYEDQNGDTPLHYLCKTENPNRPALIKLFIKNNASINRTNSLLETPLHLLCKNKKPDFESIKILGEKGVAFNLKESMDGNTPLHILCDKEEKSSQETLEIINYLLTENADINTKNSHGNNVCHLVLKQKIIDHTLFELIINNDNLDLDSMNDLKETFFHCLLKKDDKQKIIMYLKELLNKGCNPNLQDNNGWTPLHLICSKPNDQKNVSLINLFIENGADPNIGDKEGRNLLHHVIPKTGNMNNSLVEILMKNNVDCNKQDHEGVTPFIKYCQNDTPDVDMINVFLQDGKVDLNLYTKNGRSPLHMIIDNSSNLEILEILIDNNDADVEIKDSKERNLLHYACKNSQPNIEIIKYLIDKELDPNEKESKNGWTCLHFLAHQSDLSDELTEVIEFLIENDADVTIKDNAGNLPFHLICNNEEFNDALFELLADGIDINDVNDNGETPLHLFILQPDRTAEHLEWFKDMEADFTIGRESDEKNALHLHFLNEPDEDVLSYLVDECECEIDSKDNFNNNLLHLLCQSSQISNDLIENLIEDLDINEPNNEGKTALHLVCGNNPDAEFIECLIENENDINIKDNEENLALHELCKDKKKVIFNEKTQKEETKYFSKSITTEQLKLFFENDVEINEVNNNGDTALICLCKNKKFNENDKEKSNMEPKIDVFKLFLEYEADYTIQNNEQSTALHELCKHDYHDFETFLFFLELEDTDLNLPDKDGNTILHLLCMQSFELSEDLPRIIQHMATLDCNLNLKNNNEQTPLLILFNSKYRHHETSFDLINHGADPLIKDKNQRNLLHLMNISQPYYHAIHFLINKGVGYKDIDVFGNTPLHCACNHEEIDFDIVRIFTELGMNLNQTNLKGETPSSLLNGKSEKPQFNYQVTRFLTSVKFAKKQQKIQKLIRLNADFKPLPSLSGKIPKHVGGFLKPMKFQEIPLDQIKINPKPIFSGEKKNIYIADWFGQKVCATTLKDSIFITKTEVEKFKKELSFVCSLHYPHTVRFFGAQLQDETKLTYISEYCENGDLNTYISKNNISLTNKIKIASGIAKGIAYLHSKNTMHRKLKTSKIVLDRRLRPKITGYGFSRQMTDTLYSTVLKTIQTVHDPYQSPEMLAESDTYDFKTDVYSFGIILWELMNNKKLKITDPIVWGSKRWTEEIMKGNRPPLKDCKCKKMIARCWHQDPDQRPEMKEILEYFMLHEKKYENMN